MFQVGVRPIRFVNLHVRPRTKDIISLNKLSLWSCMFLQCFVISVSLQFWIKVVKKLYKIVPCKLESEAFLLPHRGFLIFPILRSKIFNRISGDKI